MACTGVTESESSVWMLHASSETLPTVLGEEDTGCKCCYDFPEACGLHGTSNVSSRFVGKRVIRCSSRHLHGLHVMAGFHEPTTRCSSLCFNASLVGSGNDSVIFDSFSVVRK